MTQANIASTICSPGWTDTVRPSETYTERVKLKQIRLYGYIRSSPFDFEEDHLIPLELGGAPYSPKNLWPEQGTIPNPKDSIEDALNNAVCDGTVSLDAARHAMAVNWTTAESVLGISSSGGGSDAGANSGSSSGGSTPAPAPTHHHSTSAPTGCTPTTDSGNCYEAGEFCRHSDHGVTGVAGNGEAIKCENTGSPVWRWEPA